MLEQGVRGVRRKWYELQLKIDEDYFLLLIVMVRLSPVPNTPYSVSSTV